MDTWLLFLGAGMLAAFGGLMAAVDAAIGATSRTEIAELAEAGRNHRSLLAISTDTVAHVNAVNFVRIFSETTAAVFITVAFGLIFDNIWLVFAASAVIMTGVSFVLVGASPRSVGRVHAPKVLRLSAGLVHAIRLILGPIARLLVLIGNRVTPGRARFAKIHSEEQLLNIVDEATEFDLLDENDRDRIHSVFEFSGMVVREAMVARTDMVTLDTGCTLDTAMAQFLNAGFSRIPVIAGDADDVLGVLYLRDVARRRFQMSGKQSESKKDVSSAESIDDLVRPVMFVPESLAADSLLRTMQRESNHLAIVVDEYGGVAGLVTLEDLIEELLGDISDEHDRGAAWVEELSENHYRVNARLSVADLGDLFELELVDEDVDSVGGLLSKELGRIPVPGDCVTVSGLVLSAERTEGRRKRISTIVVYPDPALQSDRSVFDDLEKAARPNLSEIDNDDENGEVWSGSREPRVDTALRFGRANRAGRADDQGFSEGQ